MIFSDPTIWIPGPNHSETPPPSSELEAGFQPTPTLVQTWDFPERPHNVEDSTPFALSLDDVALNLTSFTTPTTIEGLVLTRRRFGSQWAISTGRNLPRF